jgi:hypothetical protein
MISDDFWLGFLFALIIGGLLWTGITLVLLSTL